MEARAEQYLEQYLRTLTPMTRAKYHSYSADYFCADEENANLCAELIRIGQKTATCSLKDAYEFEHEPLPKVGHLQVVTDWQGHPVCIIEIDSVEECKYMEVSAEFAHAEGEGDRSLAWWRQAHWAFFSDICQSLSIVPSEEMRLVLERFHVVYPCS